MSLFAFLPTEAAENLGGRRKSRVVHSCDIIVDANKVVLSERNSFDSFQQSMEFDQVFDIFPDIIMELPLEGSSRLISVCSSESTPSTEKIKETCLQLIRYYYPEKEESEIFVSAGLVFDENIQDFLSVTNKRSQIFETIPTYHVAEAIDLIEVSLVGMKRLRDGIFVMRLAREKQFFEWVVIPSVETYVECISPINLPTHEKMVFILKKIAKTNPQTFDSFCSITNAFKLIADSFTNISTTWVGHFTEEAKLISNSSIFSVLRGASNKISPAPVFQSNQLFNVQSMTRSRRMGWSLHGRSELGDEKTEGQEGNEEEDFGQSMMISGESEGISGIGEEIPEVTLEELEDLSFLKGRDMEKYALLSKDEEAQRMRDSMNQSINDQNEGEGQGDRHDIMNSSDFNRFYDLDSVLSEREDPNDDEETKVLKRIARERRLRRRAEARARFEAEKQRRLEEVAEQERLDAEKHAREEEEENERANRLKAIREAHRNRKKSKRSSSPSKKSPRAHVFTDTSSTYSRISRRNRLSLRLQSIRENQVEEEESDEEEEFFEEDTNDGRKHPPKQLTPLQKRQKKFEQQRLLAFRCLSAAGNRNTSMKQLKKLDEELAAALKESRDFREGLVATIITTRKELADKKAAYEETSQCVEESRQLLQMLHNDRVQQKYKVNHPEKFGTNIDRNPVYAHTKKILQEEVERMEREVAKLRRKKSA